MTRRKQDRPTVAPCSRCGVEFSPKSCRAKFCSETCRVAEGNARTRHAGGPCLTCGEMFVSRTPGKKYCTLACYVSSPQFAEMCAANVKAICPEAGTPRVCVGCGAEYPRSRKAKFCTRQCGRRYFAERFDRWIANPESVALPQNFDEFLARDVLSCPVDGCDWEGTFLGTHVNFAHGIEAREFKKLCGFNVTSGLVGQSLSESMSEKAKGFIADGTWSAEGIGGQSSASPTREPYVSLERREKAAKIRADLPKLRDSFSPCKCCGRSVQQPYTGRRLYCSTDCRSESYKEDASAKSEQLKCARCGKDFLGRSETYRRSESGLPVYCSLPCRNTANAQQRRKKESK